MEEHGLLHPWDEVARRDLRARTCDLLIDRLELRGQQLSLAARQQERGVLGSTIAGPGAVVAGEDRKSTRLNSSHVSISYAVFCLKKKRTYPLHDHYSM